MADTDLDPARASPSSDAQEHRRTLARNGLRLPYHERIRLKNMAEKKAEKQRRERKDHQDCHIECGKHDRQRTRGRGFYGAEEDQHHVRPRDKVEEQQGERAGKWL